MASSANDISTLQGDFKKQFHKEIVDQMPDYVLLQRDGFIDWVPSDKMNGELYSIPTLLRSNQGVSYLGEGGLTGSTLQDAVPGLMKEAQVKGTEINVRGRLTYKALSQASSAGPRAFKKAAGWLVEDLGNVAFTRLEISALYGQSGLGVISTYTNVSGSTYDIVITDDSWAPGIWVGAEGALLQVLDDAATGLQIGSGDVVLTITRVTVTSKTLRVTKTGTGTPANPDVLVFKSATAATSAAGADTWNEMVGLYKQITNTTSTLFNIDRSAYTLIQGNTKSSVGAITKAKVIETAMLTVDKGNMSNLKALVSTKAWAKLAAEDLALRQFDGSYSADKAKSGARSMSYEYVGGTIEVICHPMVKQSEFFVFNPDDVIFCGSTKVTFQLPGRGDEFFLYVPDTNQVELQCMADCALYHMRPSRAAVGTGVTYS